MIIFIIVIVVLIILAILFNKPKGNNEFTNSDNEINYDLSNFVSNQYVMTYTELTFYRGLKLITDELDLTIFPQVNLEKIIKVKDDKPSDRNRIKSRSIDFTIVSNKNCKTIACIELDDYRHEFKSVKRIDEFKNMLFRQTNIPLHRIEVTSHYNFESIKEMLKQDILMNN